MKKILIKRILKLGNKMIISETETEFYKNANIEFKIFIKKCDLQRRKVISKRFDSSIYSSIQAFKNMIEAFKNFGSKFNNKRFYND